MASIIILQDRLLVRLNIICWRFMCLLVFLYLWQDSW